MSEFAKNILNVHIVDELKKSYIDYAMSVIVGRALPDIRDGLKPVHRRIMFAMSELNNFHNKSYKKSARIVGDVVGKYHPHGETAVYDAIVRMAQNFSLRYLLVDGQGNFGSVDGDAPAAMRYTEIKMSKMASELLADLDKETVNFVPNYDNSEQMPEVLPTKIPNLLINGSSGIAVGMATNIPPHNLSEVVSACIEFINNPEITIDELMNFIKGPDFPTSAFINGKTGISEAYHTGKGKIRIRSKYHIEYKKDREVIVVTEIPYQVNKARLIEKIAELVKNDRVDSISDLRDESDKDGMRIVIELKRGESANVIMNQLYDLTSFELSYGINMVALANGQPQLFNLKEMIYHFIDHRKEVVTRRCLYELKRSRHRAHILEGLAIAIVNIDKIIELIRQATDTAEATEHLKSRVWDLGEFQDKFSTEDIIKFKDKENIEDQYGITDNGYQLSMQQVKAILALRLQNLTSLEKNKTTDEYVALIEYIKELLAILSSQDNLKQIVLEELEEIKTQYGDKRKTEIIETQVTLNKIDFIQEEQVVIIFSLGNYISMQSLDNYRAQNRGGRGKSAIKMKDNDVIVNMITTSNYSSLACFSTKGKVYWLKAYDVPISTNVSRGKPIVNLLNLESDESITAVLPVEKDIDPNNIFVMMCTKKGVIKKTPLSALLNNRSSGIIAINIREGDKLIQATLSNGENEIMLFATNGKANRFSEKQIRSMGRTATGVRGINLTDKESVVSMNVIDQTNANYKVLAISENGFGKCTEVNGFPITNRGGKGVIALKVSPRNGKVMAVKLVEDTDEVIIITENGTTLRNKVSNIPVISRNTQGVRLMRLEKNNKIASVAKIILMEEDIDSNQNEIPLG